MQGPNRGKDSGKILYAILCAYEDNDALYTLVKKIHHEKPRWIQDIGAHCVSVASAKLASRLHSAILEASSLKKTAETLNEHLDLSLFDGVPQPEFTLATSEVQFETTKDGVLPRSIMIVGKHTYAFKEFLKEKFPTILYMDLVFDGGQVTKSAWVLPVSAQTEETGTLAEFLESLGARVTEVDLDVEEEDDDEAPRDADGFVDGEAEEVSDDK